MNKTITTILLAMVGFDLTLYITDFAGHRFLNFPSWTFYQIFWISFWGIAFLLLLWLRFKNKIK